MREVLRTNDIVLQSLVVSLLKEAQIPTSVADEGISFAEGSIGAFPRRILVPEAFAEEAIGRGTGARALRSIFEKLMLDVMFDAPNHEHPTRVVIDREVVEGKREPVAIEDKSATKGGEKEAA